MFKWKPVKTSYGKPWAKLKGKDFADRGFLTKVGKVLVASIVREAKKEASGHQPSQGTPEGIPKDPKFYDSFKYRIVGQSTIEVYSTWPFIQQIIEGRDPYKMTWLTKKEGVDKVPIIDPLGRVIIRSTPANENSAWIHPGFAKHTFIKKGYEMAKAEIKKMYGQQTVKVLKKNRPV